ncbi:hypothetical protein BdWA1_001395 [Babesia duncani]|uniref:Uncharacterized protein n=1 Tax=Babesia duncani TaxID=323732 RepID=A0AAD9UQR5_9APIC|nr:hypothetical protein BdWA1_001395 [Babesia duncani]
MVICSNRLYCFKKNPNLHTLENNRGLNDENTINWDLIGADILIDDQVVGGLYRWQLVIKNHGTSTIPEAPAEALHVISGLEMGGATTSPDCLFNEAASTSPVVVVGNVNSTETIWFASYNHKVARDWIMALSAVCKFGSLSNFIEQNYMRSAYSLSWYFRPLDHYPPPSVEAGTLPKSIFGHLEISIHQIIGVPKDFAQFLYCIVEVNSSLYLLNLSGTARADLDQELAMAENFDHAAAIENPNKRDSDLDALLLEQARLDDSSDDEQVPGGAPATGHGTGWNAPVSNAGRENRGSLVPVVGHMVPNPQAARVLSRLLIYRRKPVLSRASEFQKASLTVPMLQKTSHEAVWFHIFSNTDVYLGSAAISDVDFGTFKPGHLKACVIEPHESINPLNPKRLDLSEFPKKSTVMSEANAKATFQEQGIMLVTVTSPKVMGDWLRPTTVSYESQFDYKHYATKSSSAVSVSMLMNNVKRGKRCWKILDGGFRYFMGILEFRDPLVSFLWLIHSILCLYLFPSKQMLFFTIPMLIYMLAAHPNMKQWINFVLLRYPILISLIPNRFTIPLLSLPRSVCAVCARKSHFIKANATTCEVDFAERTLLTCIYSKGPKAAAQGIKRASVYVLPKPLVTSRHVLNQVLTFSSLEGTTMERCNHRGILHSYLGNLFLHFGGAKLVNNLMMDSDNGTRLLNAMFYQPPPYCRKLMPWWLNLICTIRYLVLISFITMLGGIEHVQMLHLLHRKRAFSRLTLDALVPEAPTPRVGACINQKRLARLRTLPLAWFENERRAIFGSFSRQNLRIYDRPFISDENGNLLKVPKSARRMARVSMDQTTDPEGWMYAKNWNGPWLPECFLLAMVRRRRLEIPQQNLQSESARAEPTPRHQQAAAPPPATAPDATFDPQSDPKIEPQVDALETNARGGQTPAVTLASASPQGPKSPTPEAPPMNIRRRFSLLRDARIKSQNGPRKFWLFRQSPDDGPKGPGAQQQPEHQGLVERLFKRALFHPKREAAASFQPPDGRNLNAGTIDAAAGLDVDKINSDTIDAGGDLATLDSGELEAARRASWTSEDPDDVYDTARGESGMDLYKDRGDEMGNVEPFGPRDVKDHHEQPLEKEEWNPPMGSDCEWEIVSSYRASQGDLDGGSESTLRSHWHALLAIALFPFLLILDLGRVVIQCAWLTLKFALAIPSLESDQFVHDADNVLMHDAEKLMVPIRPFGTPVERLKGGCSAKLCKSGFKISNAKRCFTTASRRRIYQAAEPTSAPFMQQRQYKRGRLYRKFCLVRKHALAKLGHYKELNFGFDATIQEQTFESDSDVYMEDVPHQELSFSDSEQEDSQPPESQGADERELPEDHPVSKREALYTYLRRIYRNKIRRMPEDEEPRMVVIENEEAVAEKIIDEPSDSEHDIETEAKVGMLGLLRKLKAQVISGNVKMFIYCMRFEKIANLFTWQKEPVTCLCLGLVMAVALATTVTTSQNVMLVYILSLFKNGYQKGAWRRNLHCTSKRHIEASLARLGIYKPLWDLGGFQMTQLINDLRDSCGIKLSQTQIRESTDVDDLATKLTAQVVATKLDRGWPRRSWWHYLYRQSPANFPQGHSG